MSLKSRQQIDMGLLNRFIRSGSITGNDVNR